MTSNVTPGTTQVVQTVTRHALTHGRIGHRMTEGAARPAAPSSISQGTEERGRASRDVRVRVVCASGGTARFGQTVSGRRAKIRMAARMIASTRVQAMSATRAANRTRSPGRRHAVEREHAEERLDERLGHIEDELDDVVAGVRDEQQQDDPQDQQDLQDAEREGHDPRGERGAAGSGRRIGACPVVRTLVTAGAGATMTGRRSAVSRVVVR